jgi:hypothetical protein
VATKTTAMTSIGTQHATIVVSYVTPSCRMGSAAVTSLPRMSNVNPDRPRGQGLSAYLGRGEGYRYRAWRATVSRLRCRGGCSGRPACPPVASGLRRATSGTNHSRWTPGDGASWNGSSTRCGSPWTRQRRTVVLPTPGAATPASVRSNSARTRRGSTRCEPCSCRFR